MKNFLKENFVLVIGIALPVIMVIIFGVATILPQYFVAPPQYNLLYSTGYYDFTANGLKFDVVNGKLTVHFVCDSACVKNNWPSRMPVLYLFDVKSRQASEIKIDIPKIAANSQPLDKEIIIPAVSGLKIDPASEAPDGYKYTNNDRYNGGLLIDLFYGSRYTQATISKEGYTITIMPENKNYYSHDIKFIGWVVTGKEK